MGSRVANVAADPAWASMRVERKVHGRLRRHIARFWFGKVGMHVSGLGLNLMWGFYWSELDLMHI